MHITYFRYKFKLGMYSFAPVTACPHCEENVFSPYAVIGKSEIGLEIQIVECTACQLLLQNPTLDQLSLNRYYRDDYSMVHSGVGHDQNSLDSRFAREMRRGRYIIDYVQSHGYCSGNGLVAEIGCSSGGILNIFQQAGACVVGCDLDRRKIKYGRDQGIDIREGNVDVLGFAKGQVGIVIMSHVLEHMQDPLSVLASVRDLLAPGGMAYIEVPGIDNELIKMEYNAQLGHLLYFNLGTLKSMALKAGLNFIHGNDKIQSLFQPTLNMS